MTSCLSADGILSTLLFVAHAEYYSKATNGRIFDNGYMHYDQFVGARYSPFGGIDGIISFLQGKGFLAKQKTCHHFLVPMNIPKICIYRWLCKVCSTKPLQTPILLGGLGVFIQIDESLFCHKPVNKCIGLM